MEHHRIRANMYAYRYCQLEAEGCFPNACFLIGERLKPTWLCTLDFRSLTVLLHIDSIGRTTRELSRVITKFTL